MLIWMTWVHCVTEPVLNKVCDALLHSWAGGRRGKGQKQAKIDSLFKAKPGAGKKKDKQEDSEDVIVLDR